MVIRTAIAEEEQVDENERVVIALLTLEKWQRIIEVAASDPKDRDLVEVSGLSVLTSELVWLGSQKT